MWNNVNSENTIHFKLQTSKLQPKTSITIHDFTESNMVYIAYEIENHNLINIYIYIHNIYIIRNLRFNSILPLGHNVAPPSSRKVSPNWRPTQRGPGWSLVETEGYINPKRYWGGFWGEVTQDQDSHEWHEAMNVWRFRTDWKLEKYFE